jgi:Ca2+-binding RTX toxin-like protein
VDNTRPKWSPSGQLSYINSDFSDIPESWLVAGNRSFSSRAVYASAGWLAWSPDGEKMMVSWWDPGVSIVSGLDGPWTTSGNSVQLPGMGDAFDPDWQPNCTLSGSSAGDVLDGTDGADIVCGLGGDDRITGGTGSDRLFGGDGDDTIDARDGAFDVVGCGTGTDTVHADRSDLVGRDCEHVTRP